MPNMESFDRATLIDVRNELPANESIVFTVTESGAMGMCYYTDDEFISLMPTFLGHVKKWWKNPDGGNLPMYAAEQPEVLV